MDTPGPGWIAAAWGLAFAAIYGCIRWVAARLVVPRDHEQARLLRDLKKDLDGLGESLTLLDGKVDRQGKEIAFMRGVLDKHYTHDGR